MPNVLHVIYYTAVHHDAMFLSPLPPRSTWESKGHYEDWLKSPVYKKIADTVSELEEERTSKKTRVFESSKEEIFLL
jgi:hypothetical protein